MGMLDDIRSYWDTDAATYDASRQHRPTDGAVVAAWTAALEAALPPVPARVLDCGAGTGFLTVIAARLGHHVTALDLAPEMLRRLEERAAAEGLAVETVVAPATEPPAGPFDAVVERHLLWTLPDPGAALAAWRAAAPKGRLVLVESLWGDADPVEALRGRARALLRSVRRTPSDHHAEYEPQLRDALPLGNGTPPRRLAELVGSAGWATVRLVRLRDVEWAERLALPLPERLVGPSPRFVLTAR